MFIPGRKRRSDGIQCMCRKTLGGILKFDRHCNFFLFFFCYGAHYAFSNQQEQDTDQVTQLKSTTSAKFSIAEDKKECFPFKFSKYFRWCSDHKIFSWSTKLTGDYPTAQFERSRLKSVQEGPKISLRRIRESVIDYLL